MLFLYFVSHFEIKNAKDLWSTLHITFDFNFKTPSIFFNVHLNDRYNIIDTSYLLPVILVHIINVYIFLNVKEKKKRI